jgi:DNA-binding SARP family transcriptional activator
MDSAFRMLGRRVGEGPGGHTVLRPSLVVPRGLECAAASDTDSRRAARHAAIAAYTGPLAGDHDYYWISPIREETRRQAIDAHIALADLLADSDLAAALEQAIGHDPNSETLYQHGMRLNAAQRAFPAVAALSNRLGREHADIGTSPTSPTTCSPTRRHTN